MTAVADRQVACRKCGAAGSFQVYSSINPAGDASLREKLFSGDVFTFRCKACGTSELLFYPMLYHDPSTQLMCWLMPLDATGKPDLVPLAAMYSEGYAMRAVGDLNALIEKIVIVEAGLDDVVIEMVKLVSLAAAPEGARTFFESREVDQGEDSLRFVRLDSSGPSIAHVPFAHYQTMRERYAALGAEWLGRGYRIVDEAFAKTALAGSLS